MHVGHKKSRHRGVLLVGLCFLALPGTFQLTACSTIGATKSSSHPLAGQIHDVKRDMTISKDALLRELVSADFVLLGEVHDNPEHHELQLEVLRSLVAQGRMRALAMEQFDREFQPAIDAALAQAAVPADAVAGAGGFDRKGWSWPFYAPLVATAVDARLPIVAINLSRQRAREIARLGFAALGPGMAEELALERHWTAAQQAIQMREIDEGHCGKMPSSAMPGMVDVQRARDATMADALLRRAGAGVVVIAGAGHVRNDVGVPMYLSARAPAKRVVSVGFVEVDADLHAIGDYVRSPATAFPFDYVWFTTAAKRDDPCVGLVMPNRQ